MLTKRQKQILDYVKKFIKEKSYSPSFEEIRRHFGFVSKSTVHHHIETLKEKGYLKRSRTIELPKAEKSSGLVEIPLLGTIAAGQPIEAIQEKETIAVPQDKLPRSGDFYALRVMGDSMIDEGINDGDVILVKQQSIAENGQKVVALVDNYEATLKKFYKERGYIRLQPANKTMEPLIFRKGRDISIQGIVLDVIKNIGTPIPESILLNTSSEQTARMSKPYFKTDDLLIYKDDILKINSIPNNSVDLIVTSPPYNVDIHYNSHADNLSYDDYLEFTRKWIKKCFELTKNEGRFLLNIPLDKNKGGQKSVGADFTRITKEIGWKYHSTIVWNEGNISRRTAWGSFMSASAPYVIAPVELILVLYKDSWKKTGGSRKNDITKQEFMDWTNGVWTFNGQSKKGAGGHPAPFPIELPRRCIKLFSFIGDTVLDPFLGSGSTLIASYLHKRKGIGVEIDKKYCDIAIDRLRREAKIGQGNLLK